MLYYKKYLIKNKYENNKKLNLECYVILQKNISQKIIKKVVQGSTQKVNFNKK